MLLTTTLTDDFKLVVPKEARDAAGWQSGQLFVFDVFGCNVNIQAASAELVEAYKAADLEIAAETTALGGSEMPLPLGPEVNPIDALHGLMAGKEVEEFVRDRGDRY